MRIVEERARKLQRSIRRRDRLEILAALLVVPLFLLFAYQAGTGLERLGHLLVAGSGLLIIAVLRRFRPRLAPEADLDSRRYVEKVVAEYERQISLLKNVKYWYLLPPYAGILLAWAGRWDSTHAPIFDLLVLGLITAFFLWVWWLNEVAGVRRLRREKEELLGLVRDSA